MENQTQKNNCTRYCLSFKEKIIKFIENQPVQKISDASKSFEIDPRYDPRLILVGRWLKSKEKIKKTNFKRKKYKVRETNEGNFPEMKHGLINWINEMRSFNRCVSVICIRRKALKFHKEIYQNFSDK